MDAGQHEAKLAGIGGMTCRQESRASRRGRAGQKAVPYRKAGTEGMGDRQTHRQRRQATHSRLAVQDRQDKLGT